MIRIEEIVENVASNHPQADLDLLRRAYLFSAREHKGRSVPLANRIWSIPSK